MSRPAVPDHGHRTLKGTPRRIVRRILLIFFGLLIRMRVEHVERVPPKGGVLLVANHLHNLDPILTSAAFPRAVHYMAKKEIFSNRILKAMLESCGTFPVDRGKSDRQAIKAAQERLAQGIPVGIFPEGTRSPSRALKEAYAGAGMLALTANCPVVPIAVTGTERLPLNGSKGKLAAGQAPPDPGHSGVRLSFGDPFMIPREIDGRRITSDEATEIMMVELARILPPDYRGIYADKLAAETVRRAQPVPAT